MWQLSGGRCEPLSHLSLGDPAMHCSQLRLSQYVFEKSPWFGLDHPDFAITQRAMPPRTRTMPSHVSSEVSLGSLNIYKTVTVPRDMTLPSAHHSPSTVKRKANELVMGTVRLSSACPMIRKNRAPPEMLRSSGIAYAGFLSRSVTVYMMVHAFRLIQDMLWSSK